MLQKSKSSFVRRLIQSVALAGSTIVFASSASAQSNSADIERLTKQLQDMQRQIDALREADRAAAAAKAAPASTPPRAHGTGFGQIRRNPGGAAQY